MPQGEMTTGLEADKRADKNLRTCCVTRESLPKADLIRFALGPNGEILPDIAGKAGARGVWVTANEQILAQAVAKKAFARALKTNVNVPDNLVEITRAHLQKRLLGALGLAMKGGHLVTGYAKVRSAIEKGKIDALIAASDGSMDGRKKMTQLLRAVELEDEVPLIDFLTAEQLSLALGGKNVIHAALVGGAATKSAMDRAHQLARFSAENTG
ncbi:RNA-binding protein [Maritalea mediterranea]|uniref:RNA-binding protein n=1 Tax=Maritalea mediterranea TaxID=2909667 RepID=A0ABS9E6F1_9HYPH|nr:RNA-binding protein [Maritalea mediterranea]MCF4097008.1 RNA-binding protein [Maritalea mediterranea]